MPCLLSDLKGTVFASKLDAPRIVAGAIGK
jgi:hypothetical protein